VTPDQIADRLKALLALAPPGRAAAAEVTAGGVTYRVEVETGTAATGPIAPAAPAEAAAAEPSRPTNCIAFGCGWPAEPGECYCLDHLDTSDDDDRDADAA
jgi:hypothetical protein